jgi:acetyl esterase/lipase
MRQTRLGFLLACLLTVVGGTAARSADAPDWARTQDVIYGRKYGLALTMDVFTPKKANGLGVIYVVSGGWFSRPQAIHPALAAPLLKRGYTVFAVVHGSQPKFTVPEIIEDMHRAVRFIRHNASRFKIDPDRLGIYGASAGGHLSLVMGTMGKDGDPKAADPVDRASSRVQAVACFFPPTDFLNWGEKGKEMLNRALQPPFTAAVDFHEFDSKKALFIPVTDEKKLREIMRQISPAHHVDAANAPTLILHGDKDDLVPLQQAELILTQFKEAGVPAELIVRKGEKHGWRNILDDIDKFADWFDKYLKPAKIEK